MNAGAMLVVVLVWSSCRPAGDLASVRYRGVAVFSGAEAAGSDPGIGVITPG